MPIIVITSPDQIRACFPVMRELRSHLSESEFIDRVQREMQAGYQLAYLTDNDVVKAVAGFRTGDFLAWGRIMYVDDLVCTESDRGKGYGGQLLEWLMAHARELGCEQFHLDSGTHREAAHRFYIAHGMEISSYHFSIKF